MRTKLKVLVAIVCILSMLLSGIGALAAGYDVVSETDIDYKREAREAIGYYAYVSATANNNYATLISNFSNGFSVVYENCEEQTPDMVYYTTVESSYVIDEKGNKVDIGEYDKIGVANMDEDGQAVLPGRTTHFENQFPSGVDMYGGVIVFKNGKYGYIGLKDGIKIPCEHDREILRYDENVFGVGPDHYLGQAEYFINAKGEKLLSDIDLSPIKNGTGTFTPSLKYLGNNMFYHVFAFDIESYKPSIRYIDINGNEVQGYTPKVDESQIQYTFDSDVLKNFYSYDYLELGDRSIKGNKGIFINTDANGKFGLLDKNANLIVPYIFDDISGLQDGYCWAARDGKWSLLQIATDEVTVKVDNENVVFDQIPLIINGRTLAPLRAIFEKLGATVEWNGETQTITSTKGDTVITMTIDKNEMYKNGEMIWLDVAPQIVGERTLVPVRAIAEAFNCDVTWDGENHTVNIAK